MTSNLETWRPVAVFSCMIRNETTLNQHQQEGLAAVCYRKTILFLGGLGGRASKFDEVRIFISNIKAARLFMLNPPGQKYEKNIFWSFPTLFATHQHDKLFTPFRNLSFVMQTTFLLDTHTASNTYNVEQSKWSLKYIFSLKIWKYNTITIQGGSMKKEVSFFKMVRFLVSVANHFFNKFI